MPKSIVFVCTGNIFRSMTAEYALRSALGVDSDYSVSSAGTNVTPQPINPHVKGRLLERGIDPCSHQQQALTSAISQSADLLIAMGRDHQAHIEKFFVSKAPLFFQICYGLDAPVLDVHEAIPNWRIDPERATEYSVCVVDQICEAMPSLIENLDCWVDARRAAANVR